MTKFVNKFRIIISLEFNIGRDRRSSLIVKFECNNSEIFSISDADESNITYCIVNRYRVAASNATKQSFSQKANAYSKFFEIILKK